MIKIENFNFNEKGEIIGIGNKIFSKIIVFNNEKFKNLKELFIYLTNDFTKIDELTNNIIEIELENKEHKKQNYELLKVDKENDNLKLYSFNEALLNYQPFCELKEDNNILLNSKLTPNTKKFVSKCMRIKK